MTARQLLKALKDAKKNPEYDMDADITVNVQGEWYALDGMNEAGSSPLFVTLKIGAPLS